MTDRADEYRALRRAILDAAEGSEELDARLTAFWARPGDPFDAVNEHRPPVTPWTRSVDAHLAAALPEGWMIKTIEQIKDYGWYVFLSNLRGGGAAVGGGDGETPKTAALALTVVRLSICYAEELGELPPP